MVKNVSFSSEDEWFLLLLLFSLNRNWKKKINGKRINCLIIIIRIRLTKVKIIKRSCRVRWLAIKISYSFIINEIILKETKY